ncbi:MAG: mismatch-specific DNA-glycosylase [Gammaproteobacteria bacterium]|nr:mismatch-specific DNA-glycosylase [Gammaproteobacteria bacterium]
MKSLPDYLRPGLRLVSIGLNPSVASVSAGVYFVNPRNRFWRALRESGLAGRVGEPSPEEIERLFNEESIGFTDVVKRPTRGGSALRAADFRRDAPRLGEKLRRFSPRIAWFHGKQAYGQYLRYAENSPGDPLQWGLQSRDIAGCQVFVTPNPSPANAVYSLDDLVAWYRELAGFVGRGT